MAILYSKICSFSILFRTTMRTDPANFGLLQIYPTPNFNNFLWLFSSQIQLLPTHQAWCHFSPLILHRHAWCLRSVVDVDASPSLIIWLSLNIPCWHYRIICCVLYHELGVVPFICQTVIIDYWWTPLADVWRENLKEHISNENKYKACQLWLNSGSVLNRLGKKNPEWKPAL